MHNFDDLQKRCKKYRIKRVVKYFVVSFVVFAAVAFSLFFKMDAKVIAPKLSQKKSVVIKHLQKKVPLQKMKKTKIIKKKELSIPVKKRKEDSFALKKTYALQFLVSLKNYKMQINRKKKFLESLGFKECKLAQSGDYIHLVCDESESLEALKKYIELAQRDNLDYVIRTQMKQQMQTMQKKNIEKKIVPIKKKIPAPVIEVKNSNIQELQDKFLQAPNYNVAIIIARSYYKKRDFKNAIIWAKKANQIDKSDAESWIIYAKSLYALHQEDKARQLLHIYLQYENSEKVARLLQTWEKNQ